MARGRKKETVKRRDDKGRILPTGISQRPDGRYMWRCMYKGVSYGPIYSWNLGEIKKIANEQRVKIARGECQSAEKTTLNEYFYYWMETYRKGDMKEHSYQSNLDYWEWYIQSTLGRKKLCDIKARDIVKHFNQLQTRDEKPITHGTALRVCSMVSSTFEYAVKEDIILKNPAQNVAEDIKKLNIGEAREALTSDEQRKFMEYVKNHRFYKWHYPLFLFMFGTGCRVGEAAALCMSDLDFDEGRIEIYKTLHYRNMGKGVPRERFIGTTKTQSSVRSLPMLPVIKEMLKQQFIRLEMEKFPRVKVPVVHSQFDIVTLKDFYDDFVFLNREGQPYTPDYVTAIIKKIVASYNREEERKSKTTKRKARLLNDFSSHYTRHTFATRCEEIGLERSHISYWLGHSLKEGSSVTNRYIHIDTWKYIKNDVELLKDMQVA